MEGRVTARFAQLRESARALVSAGALCWAAAAWALWPVERADSGGAGIRAVLVDASDSARRTRPGWEVWLAEALSSEARAAASRGEELAVIAYAEEVVRWFGPDRPERFEPDSARIRGAPGRTAGSDLSAALAGMEASLDQRERAATVLRILGDGSYTGRDPAGALAAWTSAGARVEFVPLPAPERADPALLAARTPREIEAGAPLSIAVQVELDGARVETTSLRATLTSSAGVRSVAGVVRDGASRLDLGPLSPGLTQVRLELVAEGDPTPENNRIDLAVRARDALVIGLLSSPGAVAARGAMANTWARLPGLATLELDDPVGAPLDAAIDALVTLDLDPRELPRAEWEGFVARGGGWLACGGHALLEALASDDRRGAAQLLPLEVDRDESRERDVLLIVDASGSMSGEAFAGVRQAAVELVASARPEDTVILRFFTDRLSDAVLLGRGGGAPEARAHAARALIEARAPGGPTDVVRTLEQLVDERESSQRDALVLLLTDGRDQDLRGSSAQRVEIAIERLAAARARLTTIAFGPQPDWNFLQLLERPALGAALKRPENGLAELFDEELARGWLFEGPLATRVVPTSASEFTAELAAALAAGGGPAPVLRAIKARARAGDQALIEEQGGHPLAAVRPTGAGWFATLATLPGDTWAPEWSSDPERWLPLLRALGRGRSAGLAELRAELSPERTVRVAPVPSSWPTELSASVVSGGADSAAPLELRAVQHPAFAFGALREGPIPEGLDLRPGRAQVRLATPGGQLLAVLGIELPCAEEHRRPARRIAAAGPSVGSADAGRSRAPRAATVGWALLAVGMACGALGGACGAVSAQSRARG